MTDRKEAENKQLSTGINYFWCLSSSTRKTATASNRRGVYSMNHFTNLKH